MKNTVFLSAFAFLPTLAFGACSNHICSSVLVERLYINSNGKVYIGSSGDESQLDCQSVSGVYTSFDVSEPGGDSIYATLLAAQLSNKPVSIRIVNNSEGCKVLYLLMDK